MFLEGIKMSSVEIIGKLYFQGSYVGLTSVYELQ